MIATPFLYNIPRLHPLSIIRMAQNCYINIIIAHSDCFALRGVQAILQEHPGITVSACAADFTDLSTSAITLHPHIIILDSGLPGLTSPTASKPL